MNTFNHNFNFNNDKNDYAFQIRTRFPWWLLVIAIFLSLVAIALTFVLLY